MCGIAGLIFPQPTSLETDVITRLLGRLAHRGPDDVGLLRCNGNSVWVGRQWRDGAADLILLHRRLSIIDLSDAGWQPMTTADGRYFIVYNGELYNYIELRAELAALGHRFCSASDTEVLLAAYVQWGREALRRLEGMFAFALLDRRQRTLTLARDPFGIKPLYLTHWHGGLAFASEIKALLELPDIDRGVNPQRLWQYLRYGVTDHGEDTLFRSCQQIAAGHYATVALERPACVEQIDYWRPTSTTSHAVSFDDAVHTVRQLFLRNVERHIRSDVPVGAALSGGIDSSAIISSMRRTLGPTTELHTVSYMAEPPGLNEANWAEMAGRHASAVSHAVHVTASELMTDLERVVWVQDEPFGSSSVYAQYRVFQKAREAGIKVMLDGQGADEILAGYAYYLPARVTSLVHAGAWMTAWRLLREAANRWPGGLNTLLAASGASLMPHMLHTTLRRWVGKDLMPDWLCARWFREREVVPNPLFVPGGHDVFKEQLRQSLCFWSVPMLLRYEDRNSMAHSIESRVPFLTTDFVDYVWGLPANYLLSDDGTSKNVFRAAMRGIVPDAILNRQDKIAFATPEEFWFRGPQRTSADKLVDETLGLYPEIFEPVKTRALVCDMLDGHRPVDPTLWRIINIGVWGRMFTVTL